MSKKELEPVFDVYGFSADDEKKRADDPLYWPHGESAQAAILFSVRTVHTLHSRQRNVIDWLRQAFLPF